MSLEGRRSSTTLDGVGEINLEEWLDKCPDEEPDSMINESYINEIATFRSRHKEPEVAETYKYAVDKYTEIGMPPEIMEKKLTQYDSYLSECLTIVRKVVLEEYNKFAQYKGELIEQIKKMRNDLYLPPQDDEENVPLVQLCKRLRTKFNKLNAVKQERMARLQDLRDRQLKHCLVLGIKPPEVKTKTDIPTSEELDNFAKAVHDLSLEEKRRRAKYTTLIDTISKCIDQVEYTPKDNFESKILTAEPSYTDDYLSKMTDFLSKLEKLYASNQKKYENLKSRLDSLYDRLDIDKKERDEFFEIHSSCKPSLMADMEVQIEKYEELKKQNIGKFIEKIKEELKVEYRQCYVSEEQQENFFSLSTVAGECNEELLELYERELKRIKKFFEDNRDILDRLAKWEQMWSEMIYLEKRANDPNRFNNRGGQLLLEEKKRKALQKGLPKIEGELRAMNDKYAAANHGNKFKIFDTNLDEYMDGCWDELHNVKEVQKRERQRAKMVENPADKSRRPQGQALLKKTPTKRAAAVGISSTPSKVQCHRSILGTPSSNNFRSNLMGLSGSVKKSAQKNIFLTNRVQQLSNTKSNIPVASNGHKTISNSNGSDYSALSMSEQEFEDMIVTCPASAKRR